MRRDKQRNCNIYSIHPKLQLCWGKMCLRHPANKMQSLAQVSISRTYQVSNMAVKTYKGVFIWPFYIHIFNIKKLHWCIQERKEPSIDSACVCVCVCVCVFSNLPSEELHNHLILKFKMFLLKWLKHSTY